MRINRFVFNDLRYLSAARTHPQNFIPNDYIEQLAFCVELLAPGALVKIRHGNGLTRMQVAD